MRKISSDSEGVNNSIPQTGLDKNGKRLIKDRRIAFVVAVTFNRSCHILQQSKGMKLLNLCTLVAAVCGAYPQAVLPIS